MCKKAHEHDRTIIAGPRDSIRGHLKRVSRALTRVADLSGSSCCVRSPALLAEELKDCVGGLVGEPSLVCAFCTEPKPAWCGCKLDATSFFTAVDRDAAIAAALESIAKASRQRYTGILICKEGNKGDKALRGLVYDRSRYWFISLETIRAALQWLHHDVLFALGCKVFRQKGGLPQGSTFSPILARFYLDKAHRMLFKHPRPILNEAARHLRVLGKVQRWTAIKVHVDDSFWCSQRLCAGCICLMAARTWPSDVGLSVEDDGAEWVFLHCRVSFGAGVLDVPLKVDYQIKNADFAAGLEHHAPVSVFPPYVRGFSTAEHLQLAAGAHIRLIAGCYRKNGECAEHSEKIVSVVCELVRLGWPRKLVVGFLFKFDHYMFPHTQTRCRAIAVWIRRHKTWYRLARKTAHSGPNADGSTHRAFFEYLLEGSNRAPRIEQT